MLINSYKLLSFIISETESKSTVHLNRATLENSPTSLEQQNNSSNYESHNPLLSMLTNLGMNVGGKDALPNVSNYGSTTQQNAFAEVTKDLSMKDLLPNGANVISAEELENQLRSSGPDNERIPAQRQVFPSESERTTRDMLEFSRTAELVNPPPGFLPPMIRNSLPNGPLNLPSSALPQLRHIINPSHPHNNLIAQSQVITTPINNQATRYPVTEHLLPMNNTNNKTFVHSSPFGLGLSIGGLQHVIGSQHSLDSQQQPKTDHIHSNTMGYPLSSFDNIPSHLTNNVNIGINAAVGRQQTPESFSLPLENLFAIPATESKVNTDNINTFTTVSAPWPPKRE